MYIVYIYTHIYIHMYIDVFFSWVVFMGSKWDELFNTGQTMVITMNETTMFHLFVGSYNIGCKHIDLYSVYFSNET